MALKCPIDAAAWRAAHPFPLAPGQMQRWVLAVKAPEEATDADLLGQVQHAFSFWVPLFPGPVQAPQRIERLDGPPPDAPPVPFELRGPTYFVRVEFPYTGEDDVMGWPTYVARRRERIAQTCPESPIDTAPLAAEVPEADAPPHFTPTPPRGRVEDDIGPFTPGIDAEKLEKRLKLGLSIGGPILALVVVWAVARRLK